MDRPFDKLRAILPAEAGKIGFVWVRFDQVSNLHFSLQFVVNTNVTAI
jgi:hypothetical protein